MGSSLSQAQECESDAGYCNSSVEVLAVAPFPSGMTAVEPLFRGKLKWGIKIYKSETNCAKLRASEKLISKTDLLLCRANPGPWKRNHSNFLHDYQSYSFILYIGTHSIGYGMRYAYPFPPSPLDPVALDNKVASILGIPL